MRPRHIETLLIVAVLGLVALQIVLSVWWWVRPPI
jgi:hypothetical protein